MKTLSIKNPLSYFVAYGLKDVENRSWTTKYRGKLYIHSSGENIIWPDYRLLPDKVKKRLETVCKNGVEYSKMESDLQAWLDLVYSASQFLGVDIEDESTDRDFEKKIRKAAAKNGYPMVSQAVIGTVELVDIVRDSSSPWSKPHQYHWILKNPQPLDKPILGVKGHLKLWDFIPPR